jgi:glycosyltransferase involved in cell wall biosynthesis
MSELRRRFSIMVSALNEAGSLASAVETIARVFGRVSEDYEILLFDDASTDGTAAIAETLARANGHVRVFHNPRRLNIGGCYKRGLREARYEYYLWLPGDNQVIVEDLAGTLPCLAQVDLIAVYPRNQEVYSVARLALSRLYTAVVNTMFGTDFRYANGANVWRTELLRRIEIRTDGFSYQTEALVRAVRSGVDFIEVGVGIRKRRHGRSSALSLKNWLKVIRALLSLWWDVRVVHRARYRRAGRKLTPPQPALSEAGRPPA